MRNSWLELRRAWRDAARHPGITLLAVASIGIGLAVNASIFSLVDAVMLRPIAIHAPGEIRRLWLKEGADRSDNASWVEYASMRDQAPAFRQLIAYSRHGAQLETKQGSVFVPIQYTSPNYFEALDLRPALGRAYSERFPEPGGVVLGESAWLRHFAGDPGIVGRQVFVNRQALTVVGVMGAEFTGLHRGMDVGIWASTDALRTTFRQEAIFRNPALSDFDLALRLGPGLSDQTMLEQGNQVIARLRQAGQGKADRRLVAVPLQESGLLRTLIISGLFAATVGLVLLVAALNVANLGLVRNEMRRRELAVRVALGASRGSLLRHLLADGLLLGAGGAGAGLVLAYWLIEAAPSVVTLLGGFALRFDARMLLYAALAMAVSVGVTVLAPWLDALRQDPLNVMRGDHAPRQVRWRRWLAGVQIALCVSLSYAGVLMSRSLSQVMGVRPGMDIDRPLLLAEVLVGDRAASLDRLSGDLAALPGVVDVAWARRVHLSGHGGGASVNVERPGSDPEKTGFNVVNHRYFAVSGARILSGRPFEAYDGPASTPVVMVNKFLASRLAADGNAVGRFLRVDNVNRLIVGVAEDGPVVHVRENPAPYLYLPAAQLPLQGEGVFLVQTGRDPALLAPAVRQAVRTAGASFELFSLATWDEHLRRANDIDRTVALLARSLAGIGLFLAAGGLFGILLYSVRRRTREFGIRLTLGASRLELARLVTRESLRLCAWALPAGLAGAVAFGYAVRAFLFGVGPAHPLNLALAASCVLAVVLLAAWWPARQAGRVDPAETLRYE